MILDHALSFLLEFVTVVPSELYSQRMENAYELLKDIDDKDTPFLALALQLKCPLWSNDNHFRNVSEAKVYSTESLMDLLRNLGSI